MDIASAIWAGVVATAVMTALIYAGPMMGMPKMDMIGMLGKMFTPNATAAKPLGTLLHFMMGALFAILYTWLWSLGLGSATWGWGIVYGLVHGYGRGRRDADHDSHAPAPTRNSDGCESDHGNTNGARRLGADRGARIPHLIAGG